MPAQYELLDQRWDWSEKQVQQLTMLLHATHLLVRCLQIAYLPEATRREVEDGLLLPPTL
jgi:hypothetical protein